MKMRATSRGQDKKLAANNSQKTAMAIATVCTHNHGKKGMTNIVMCPGHLVNKWKKEILRIAPNSDVEIVSDFDGLVKLVPRIKDKSRRRHLWLVLSKEVAKFGYQERPATNWKTCRDWLGHTIHTYCCPHCGKPLYKVEYVGRGRGRIENRVYFDERSFRHKNETNSYCMNKVKKHDPETGTYKNVRCGAKLWEAAGRTESEWVNLGADAGWIEKNKIETVYNQIIAKGTKAKKDEISVLPTLSDALNESIPAQVRPIKYPLGKYVRRFLKGCIDYALIDECHQLKARDSLQGQAFGDFLSTAKHSLCFTGTLLNGYASGIFYILYRAFPGMMKKEGFEFSSAGESEFIKQYGVYNITKTYTSDNAFKIGKSGAARTKQLPGVSPIVFTKFLLENVAFISLEDIGTGLPGYEEIPVPVDMDTELENAYKNLETNIKNHMSHGRYEKGGMKMIAQLVQAITIYPDQPYDQPPVINVDTGETMVDPPSLNKDVVRNKDIKFVELVKEKVENGEKVLVYYNWTNRTDLKSRLPKQLENEGIKCAVMSTSIKSSEREAWVEKQVKEKNIDVLLCNPTLVETGLDLLDFTTIIFYQVGYNLFTLRQASRRSWRLSQTKDVTVYFMYYRDTVQEQALSLMATKLQAAMAIEGKFSEEGLNAMSNNQDVLTQIAASVADGIKETVDAEVFSKGKVDSTQILQKEDHRKILIPKAPLIANAQDRYLEKIHNSKKRHIPLKAVGTGEKNIMKNPSLLFNVG